jgi:hypothetical protein
MNNIFTWCYSLASVGLNPNVSGWAGLDIEFNDCSLSRQAIVALFNSLPTITSAKTITLTSNYGVTDLTDADKLIAANKGWTLTL